MNSTTKAIQDMQAFCSEMKVFDKAHFLTDNSNKEIESLGFLNVGRNASSMFELQGSPSDRVHSQLSSSNHNGKLGRIILTESEAREIFKAKPQHGGRDRRRAELLANRYSVSVKTIQDIWVGRTWYRSTCHLDPSQPVNLHRLQRKPGRPLGAKDTKPRAVQAPRRGISPVSALTPAPVAPLRRRPAAGAFLDLWLQAPPAPLLAGQEGGGWACSAGWDDPFHDDWPFWAPSGSESTDPQLQPPTPSPPLRQAPPPWQAAAVG